jgi:hypothetical protein
MVLCEQRLVLCYGCGIVYTAALNVNSSGWTILTVNFLCLNILFQCVNEVQNFIALIPNFFFSKFFLKKKDLEKVVKCTCLKKY